ncbi:hypothetical protein QBC37DRAFT_291223 [Rhypophila decipiens]|uniref:Uncharacterized protein n=1 Tax=Rhypophila decipiens TaxID=261697 RepID=A0AAN6Y440_9PEZI|nr:hypothetical protein QBC37DRAFT_291223 [Rhypophila decipiens]
MDPSFHEIRGQYTTRPKERASRSSRKEPELDLSRNIYARALATPPRACATTRTVLPNFFLVKFKTVKDPEQDKNWFVPTEVSLTSDGLRVQEEMPGPGSLALCRQELFREFSVAGSKYHGADKTFGKLRQTRRQATGGKNPLWREDMDSYILTLLRGHITQCLVRFAGMFETAGRKYISKSDSWEDIKQRTSIGCVLYLGPKLDQAEQDIHESASRPLPPPPGRLSIMDLKDDKMETKVPIHDLQVLLGQENVARLRDRKALFRDGAIFVLAGKRTEDLQMQLWRLQGYMATQELDNPKKPEAAQQALP